MNTYEISYSFFLCNKDYDYGEADSIAAEISAIGCVVDIDWYDDTEDYCFDIIAEVKTESEDIEEIFKCFEKQIEHISASGDYHYVKGVDCDFYWEP